MEFDWREYLTLAKFLKNTNEIDREAALRSAVSRAYYAAFCHARNYAQYRDNFTPTGFGQDHALVRNHFKNRRIRSIHTHLTRLIQWRESCDYTNDLVKVKDFTGDKIQ